jgi:ATP-dependent protease Clp ATPase subunit
MQPSDAVACSICGKPQADAGLLIAWETGAICDECVCLCSKIVVQKAAEKTEGEPDAG